MTLTLSNGHVKQPLGFSTRAVHVGSEPDPATGAVIPPISLSTTYQQSAIGVHKGYEYSRSGNPNRDALEALLASLESGGSDSLVFSSGSAATSAVVSSLSFLYPNEPIHILCVNDVYGGTHRYLSRVASTLQGITVSTIDLESASPSTLLSALLPTTRLVWIETPTNPTLRIIDLPLLLSALPSSILSLVDNTFLSPFYQSPLLHSASIVLHSLTKYINGHSDVLAGALILPASQPRLLAHLRFLQNAMGAVPSPYDCALVQRGAKTLALRMKAHGLSALALASYLSTHPLVSSVSYPGLATHPFHARARASLAPHAARWISTLHPNPHGIPYGGMLSFTLASRAHAEAFLTSTRLFVLAESLGGVESLAEHPAAMTHAGVPEEEREALGITEGLIRLSVGVEDTDDLITDVARALDVVARLD